jgi:nucleoside-diphosphate-sugar epimerase
MTERVFLTGAGGFIGNAVARRLLAAGSEVRALTGPPGEARNAPLGVALAIAADICDGDALRALAAGAHVAIHLAGPPSVRESFSAATAYVRAHAEGTAAVLEAARDAGIERFVYVSSAEVYGRPERNPVPESARLDARSPYAAAKIGAEFLVRAHAHAHGIAATIVRPFSVYGPGMNPYALIPAIVRQLESPGPIRLADLRPERDYCHVDDVADAIVIAAGPAAPGVRTFNAGSGIAISVAELARTIVALDGRTRSVEEKIGERRPGDSEILELVADPSHARDALGWVPGMTLEEGLRTVLGAATMR